MTEWLVVIDRTYYPHVEAFADEAAARAEYASMLTLCDKSEAVYLVRVVRSQVGTESPPTEDD
jgi:hypothetical protein